MRASYNEIPSVRDSITKNAHQDFDPDDDMDYDADDEMDDDEDEDDHIEVNDEDGVNGDNRIEENENEHGVNDDNGNEEDENEEILFAFPHQELNSENEDISRNVVYNPINIVHLDPNEIFENNNIHLENEDIRMEE